MQESAGTACLLESICRLVPTSAPGTSRRPLYDSASSILNVANAGCRLTNMQRLAARSIIRKRAAYQGHSTPRTLHGYRTAAASFCAALVGCGGIDEQSAEMAALRYLRAEEPTLLANTLEDRETVEDTEAFGCIESLRQSDGWDCLLVSRSAFDGDLKTAYLLEVVEEDGQPSVLNAVDCAITGGDVFKQEACDAAKSRFGA